MKIQISHNTMCLSKRDSLFSKLLQEVSGMRIQKVREIAKKKGVNDFKISKTELIRAIQKAEGNSECFATMHMNECNQINCLWREDCSEAANPKKVAV